MSTGAPAPRQRRSGLFRRIYLGFLLTLLGFIAVSALGLYLFASVFAPAWVENTTLQVSDVRAELEAVGPEPKAMHDRAEELSQQMELHVRVFHRRDPRGGHHAGRRRGPLGPPHLHSRAHIRDLRAGQTVIARAARFSPPGVYFAIDDPESGRMLAVVGLEPAEPQRTRQQMLLGLVLGLLGALGAGAYVLARGLTGRLQMLERSADRIAGGDIHHRVDIDSRSARDEIDQVGLAFNEMAEQVDGLLHSQRSLLANVSHELRTPIARMKVLLEILEERVARLPAGDVDDADRLRKGLVELGSDVAEVETLISDLLTSGRLELAAGSGRTIARERVPLAELARELGAKFDARVEAPADDVDVEGDRLMLQRLFSNLLANARRACPDGDVIVRLEDGPDPDLVAVVVEDCGPGIPAADREVIFEPFRRLDAARARDQGGVGLGLYLCRQIARAHAGSIRVEERPDGEPGARFVTVLPRAGYDTAVVGDRAG